MVISSWKYTVCSQHVSDWYMMIVHVTGVSTWGLYTKCTICMLRLVHEDYRTWGLYTKCMICMLHVWVHCAGIICTIACYGIGTIKIFLIVIVNMEYDIIVFIAHDSVFQIWIISAEFGSSRFCWVNFSLCFFTWVRFMVCWS